MCHRNPGAAPLVVNFGFTNPESFDHHGGCSRVVLPSGSRSSRD